MTKIAHPKTTGNLLHQLQVGDISVQLPNFLAELLVVEAWNLGE